MNNQTNLNQVTSNNQSSVQKPKKSRGKKGFFFNLLLVVAVVAMVALLVRAESERRLAQKELENTASQLEELRQSTQNSGQKAAEEILGKVRKHIDVPADPAPTVATITDVEKLQANNDFYKAAKNGDNLIITEKRAILYDAQRDIVLDVVPVRVTQSPSPTPKNQTPSPSSTPVDGGTGANEQPPVESDNIPPVAP